MGVAAGRHGARGDRGSCVDLPPFVARAFGTLEQIRNAGAGVCDRRECTSRQPFYPLGREPHVLARDAERHPGSRVFHRPCHVDAVPRLFVREGACRTRTVAVAGRRHTPRHACVWHAAFLWLNWRLSPEPRPDFDEWWREAVSLSPTSCSIVKEKLIACPTPP